MSNKVLLKNNKILNKQKTLNSNIKLYCPFQGLNNAVTSNDYSQSNHPLTFNSDAKISNVQSFYNGGTSLYLDGSGSDYVEIPYHADFSLGNTFTIKAKFYTTIAGAYQEIICQIGYLNATGGFAIYVNTSNQIAVAASTNGSTYDFTLAGNTAISTNTWYDLTVVKTSTHVKTYLNNVMDGAGALVGTLYHADPIRIGAYTQGFPYPFTGYIQDVAIIKGAAWDTHKFYDSTLDAKSSYLKAAWKFGDYSTYDCIGTNHLTNNGAVTLTDIGMQGYKCATFNGSSNYFSNSYSTDFNFGTDPFSISFWVWCAQNPPANPDNLYALYDYYLGEGVGMLVFINSTGKIFPWIDGSTITGNTTVTNSQWHHVVLTRSGTSFILYVDAISDGTLTATKNISEPNKTLWIGKCEAARRDFNGKLQELIVYKGTALTPSEISILYNSGRAKLLELDNRRHSYRFYNDYLDSYSKYLVAGWNLDEASGTRYDNVKFNHLADNGSVGYSDDAVMGRVGVFNTGKYLATASTTGISGNGVRSVSCWAKGRGVTDSGYLWSFGESTNNKMFGLAVYDDGSVMINAYANDFDTGVNIDGTTWHHYVVTHDGTTVRVYIDTVEYSSPRTYNTTNSIFKVNCWPYSAAMYFNGNIANVFLYNTVLDVTAVSILYNAGVGRRLTYSNSINKPNPDFTDTYGIIKNI